MFAKIARYRLLRLTLCAVLLFGFAGAAAAAISEWDGSTKTAFSTTPAGTEADPYLIESAAQLAWLANQVNTGTIYTGRYFKLTTDIDLNWNEWTPIGPDSTMAWMFDGSFDGDGHKILNLSIAGNKRHAGLFGYAQREIKNLHLVDIRIEPSFNGAGNSYAGGIAAYATDSGKITGCSVIGSVKGGISTDDASCAGGVVGFAANVLASINNCDFKGTVTGGTGKTDSYAGGIAGRSYAKIGNSMSAGIVTGGKADTGLSYTGGIVGHTSASVEKCGTFAAVKGGLGAGGSDTGGIAGYLTASYTVSYCWSEGNVMGGDATSLNANSCTGGIVGRGDSISYVQYCSAGGNVIGGDSTNGNSATGGIVGEAGSLVSFCSSSGDVKGGAAAAFGATSSTGGITGVSSTGAGIAVGRCYSFGPIKKGGGGEKIYFGGIMGHLAVGTVVASYWNGAVSGQEAIKGINSIIDSPQEPRTVKIQIADFADGTKFNQYFNGASWVAWGTAGTGAPADIWDIPNGQWFYPSFDPSRPRLKAFFDAGGTKILPGAAWLEPNYVTVQGGGASVPVRIRAAGFDAGQIAAVSATASPAANVTFTYSGQTVTVVPNATTVAATAVVTVSWTLGGAAQDPVTFDLVTRAGSAAAVSNPTASPAGGNYAAAQNVTLTCATAGASIHYTLDGTAPTAASTVYAGPVAISSSATLKAIAIKAGMTNSTVMSESYTIGTPAGTVAMPAANPAGGTYATAQSVTLTCATAGASIHYTLDGTAPTAASTAYTGPVAISSSAMLKAVAVKAGMTSSAVMSEAYTIGTPLGSVATPAASPAGGTFSSAVNVTLTCTTAGAEIRYTLDGTTPVSSSALYTGPISIGSSKTLKAVAIKAGYTNSSILTQTYTIAAGGGTAKRGGSGGCDAGFGLFGLALMLGGQYLWRKRA